jgi:cytidylate kinase
MTVVTITGHLGTLGEVPRRVAETLGFRLVDRELVVDTAALLGWDPAEAARFDERTGGLSRSVLECLERCAWPPMLAGPLPGAASSASPEPPVSWPTSGDRFIDALRAVIHAHAATGDAVIVGRGSQAMLAQLSNTVHVRVTCPPAERARRVARAERISIEDAHRRIAASDREREAWHRKYVSIDYQAPYQYALVVNTGLYSDEFASQIIVELVRTRVHNVRPPDAPRRGARRPVPSAAFSSG